MWGVFRKATAHRLQPDVSRWKAGRLSEAIRVKSITRARVRSDGGTPGSAILYFTANPNGEAEVVTVYQRPHNG